MRQFYETKRIVVEAIPVHVVEYCYNRFQKKDLPKWVQEAMRIGKICFYDNHMYIQTDLGQLSPKGSGSYLVHDIFNHEWYFCSYYDFNRFFKERKKRKHINDNES